MGFLVSSSKVLLSLPFGISVSIFLFISAIFYYLVSLPKKVNDYYNLGLKNNINVFRWYEYALSSSLMMVLIAILFGIYDIRTLILILLLNVSMNLFRLLMEKMNQGKEKLNWLSFIFGSIAEIGSWIVILINLVSCADLSLVPCCVFVITATYFVLFNLFPINIIL